MKSAASIIKATGIIHIIHGVLMGLIFLLLLLFALGSVNTSGFLFLLALFTTASFLYIYIGYELTALRSTKKTRNLLIASISISAFNILWSCFTGGTVGFVFILELILSIVAICQIESYKKYIGR